MISVVAGFYGYARYRVHRAIHELPAKLGADIQQNTEGFTYSQSAGGKTLFSITASNAVRYKQGGKAELHNVKIISYGRDADRLDQISGDDFEYDAQTGDVTAKGKVAIDLQAIEHGTSGPSQNGNKIGSPMHLDAMGLTFNKNTGIAHSAGTVTFQLQQGSGSAVGATYDSKQNTLQLYSNIRLRTTGPKPMDLDARAAFFNQESRELRLTDLKSRSGIRQLKAGRTVLHLRDDNTIERVDASDGVSAKTAGDRPAQVQTESASFLLGPNNHATNGRLTGGVSWETGGTSPSRGTAGQVLLTFGHDNQLKSAQLRNNVDLMQLGALEARTTPPNSGQPTLGNEFNGDGLDIEVAGGNKLQQARSVGAGQILLAPNQSVSATAAARGKTVITAGQFQAKFTDDNQLSTLVGSAPVKIVSSRPGQPDRISQSHDLLATFAKGKTTTLEAAVQTGDVQIDEGQRHATADRATFNQANDAMALSGNVRYGDAASGSSLSSNTLALDRAAGQTTATGDVKTTYAEQKSGPAGAMLSPSQPVHVTAQQMVQKNSTGSVRYVGRARLWQGGNIIQAPEIDFNRNERTLEAQANGPERVSTVFVQTEGQGKTAPVEVTSDRLRYRDAERRADFTGSIVLRSADSTLHAEQAAVILLPGPVSATAAKMPAGNSPNQVQNIDATGHITLQQAGRRAIGNHLVYTADNQKFVLTGTPSQPPSIFDAEHGQVTGVSLTFFNTDGRVLVDSSNSASITPARLQK
ncbi:MAG: LPS export ABC transporter periplasmic protein LptC [Acidobacteria bacterium]|nr:LPS export ABC transporter periplasmic protein LptC [Acidobacteriota bacterium]